MARVTFANPYRRRRGTYEHILVVERVMQRERPDWTMPAGAVIHHVNGLTTDNRPCNLVVLQNTTEHMALHYRCVVLRAGGNPWTDHWCAKCWRPKPPCDFYPQRDRPLGHRSWCRACWQQSRARGIQG